MTRNADRLEILARDLASRYGDNDHVVCALRPRAVSQALAADSRHSIWRASQKLTFKHARLAKLGIGNAA